MPSSRSELGANWTRLPLPEAVDLGGGRPTTNNFFFLAEELGSGGGEGGCFRASPKEAKSMWGIGGKRYVPSLAKPRKAKALGTLPAPTSPGSRLLQQGVGISKTHHVVSALRSIASAQYGGSLL